MKQYRHQIYCIFIVIIFIVQYHSTMIQMLNHTNFLRLYSQFIIWIGSSRQMIIKNHSYFFSEEFLQHWIRNLWLDSGLQKNLRNILFILKHIYCIFCLWSSSSKMVDVPLSPWNDFRNILPLEYPSVRHDTFH